MQKSRYKVFYLFWFSLIFIVFTLACVVGVSNAYFTSTSNKQGEIKFQDLTIELSSTNPQSVFSTNLTSVFPGDTVTFNEVSVKNTGEVDIYSILNLKITITSPKTTKVETSWHNLEGGGYIS